MKRSAVVIACLLLASGLPIGSAHAATASYGLSVLTWRDDGKAMLATEVSGAKRTRVVYANGTEMYTTMRSNGRLVATRNGAGTAPATVTLSGAGLPTVRAYAGKPTECFGAFPQFSRTGRFVSYTIGRLSGRLCLFTAAFVYDTGTKRTVRLATPRTLVGTKWSRTTFSYDEAYIEVVGNTVTGFGSAISTHNRATGARITVGGANVDALSFANIPSPAGMIALAAYDKTTQRRTFRLYYVNSTRPSRAVNATTAREQLDSVEANPSSTRIAYLAHRPDGVHLFVANPDWSTPVDFGVSTGQGQTESPYVTWVGDAHVLLGDWHERPPNGGFDYRIVSVATRKQISTGTRFPVGWLS